MQNHDYETLTRVLVPTLPRLARRRPVPNTSSSKSDRWHDLTDGVRSV